MFNKLLRNIRFYVLVFSLLLAVGMYVSVGQTVPAGLQERILMQLYAFCALIFLYFALLAGPVTKLFLNLPLRTQYMKARRAIGVSAFFFAALHAYIGLFDILGGPFAVLKLPVRFKIAVFAADIALLILLLMAITSFDVMVRKLTFAKWKMLHRFVYLAGVFILIHSALIGSHFRNLTAPLPIIVYAAVTILITLHVVGLIRKHRKK